jgi:hypothetical protein
MISDQSIGQKFALFERPMIILGHPSSQVCVAGRNTTVTPSIPELVSGGGIYTKFYVE